MQGILWGGVGLLVAIAVVSGLAQHRRNRRIEMDNVGLVPWPLVQFLALLGAVLLGMLGLYG